MEIDIALEVNIPDKLHDDVIKNLYWIDKGINGIAINRDTNSIRLSYTGSATVDETVKNTKEIIHRILNNYQKIKSKTYYQATVKNVPFKADPYKELVEAGWVIPGTPGSFVYGGLMAKLIIALDNHFKRIAFKLGAAEYKFPTLIEVETLMKAGYLDAYPHNANFVVHLHEDLDLVSRFKKSLDKENYKINIEAGDGCCASPDTVLSPTVCHHLYRAMEGRQLKQQIITATATSLCYRYESKATSTLRRLREFLMREIIYVGQKEAVIEARNTLLDTLKQSIDEFELNINIVTASDPFFVDNYDKQRLYQLSFDLKHEAEAYLPFDNSWFSIASVNYHQDHFGKPFNIKDHNQNTAHSCCIGYGLDRWCYAIFSQYGLDTKAWPSSLQKLISGESF